MQIPSHSFARLAGSLRFVKRIEPQWVLAARAVVESLEDRTLFTAMYWDPSDAVTADGGSGIWSTSIAEWRSGNATGPLVTWNNSGNMDAVFPAAGGTITVAENISAKSLTFQADGYSVVENALTLSGPNARISVVGGASAEIDSPLSAANINKVDAGTLVLTGENSIAGQVRIAGGIVQLGNEKAIQNSAVLVGVPRGLTFGEGVGTFDVGGLVGSQSLSLSDTGGSPISLVLGRDGLTSRYSGVLRGDGSLTINAGMQTLAGASTYTGGTTLLAGQLNINNSQAIGMGTLTIEGGVIDSMGGGAMTLKTRNTQVWAGDFGFGGHANLNLGSGAVTLVGSRTIGVAQKKLTVSGVISDGESGYGITKTGAGTLVLKGVNTFGGSTTIDGGNVQLASEAAVQNSTVVLNQANGLRFGPGISSFNLGGLSGTAAESLTGAGSKPVAIVTGANGSTNMYSGILSGLGSLILAGGTLALLGNNTYTGGTTVNAGILLVNNIRGSGTGSAPVTVNNLGTLGGTGAVGGAVAVNEGGSLTPGDGGPGILNTGNLAMAAGSDLNIAIDGNAAGSGYAKVNVIGGAMVAGGNLLLTGTAAAQDGSQLNIVSASGAVGGTFQNLPDGGTCFLNGVTYAGKYVTGNGGGVALIAGMISTQPIVKTPMPTVTVTSIVSSASPAAAGQDVTFTATVVPTGGRMPTGTVIFRDGTTVLGVATLNGSGSGMIDTAALALGDHSISAVYSGDVNDLSSASTPLSQPVKAPVGVPAGLVTNLVSSNEVDVSWAAAANAAGYAVQRSAGSSGVWTTVGVSATTSFPDTGLADGIQYQYRVLGQNDGVNSAPSTSVGATTLLPAFSYNSPQSNPALPAGMNIFTPPTQGVTVVAGAPVVAASNDTAGPDESLSLTGSHFSTAGDYSDSRFVVFGQTTATDGTLADAAIQDPSSYGAEITLNASLPANGMYLVWPENSNGVGNPIAINQTQAWWIPQTFTGSAGNPLVAASVGQTISVYGKNLSNGAAAPQSWVYLQPVAGGTGEWASVTSFGSFKIQFAVPADLANGQYQVWVNNGRGGAYGWSEVQQAGTAGILPVALNIGASTAWSGDVSTYVNVMSFGATGNGVTDDGAAIQKAINSVQPGQTVYFPAGTYLDTGTELVVKSNVRLLGASRSGTQLLFKGVTPNIGWGSFWIGYIDPTRASNVEFNSMTLQYAGSDGVSSSLVRERHGMNLTFDNVALIGQTISNIDAVGDNGFTVKNCMIVGQNIQCLGGSNVVIQNDDFYLAHGVEEAINIWGDTNISIENCTVRDFDESNNQSLAGWGMGRMLEENLVWGSISNEYVANNTTIHLGAPSGTLKAGASYNAGEQINVEGSFTTAYGKPTSAASTTITLSSSIFVTGTPGVGQDVIVTAGAGLGQLRIIEGAAVSVDGASITLTLDHPWNVIPDSNSHVFVGSTLFNSVFYGNTLQEQTGINGSGGALSASTAFEIFNGAYNVTFDSNATDGVKAGALIVSAGTQNPCYFIQLSNNAFNNSQVVGVTFNPGSGDPQDVGLLARNNQFNNSPQAIALVRPGGVWAVGGPVGVASTYSASGTITLGIFEHNVITNTSLGTAVFVDPDVLLYKNSFDAGAYAAKSVAGMDYIVTGATALLRGNSYQNFKTNYSGHLPSSNIESPASVIYLNSTGGAIAQQAVGLWNEGGASLNWKVSSNASWLKFSSSSGSIVDQATDSLTTLTADPQGLAAGTYYAAVTLSTASNSRKLKVVLTVR